MSYFKIAAGILGDHRAEAAWVAAALGALAAMYWDTAGIFVGRWFASPAYYHCIAVPFIAGWLLWRRWNRISATPLRASVLGFAVLAFGLLLYWASARTGVRMVTGLTIPIVLAGMAGAVCGPQVLRLIVAPIAVLVFAIPFPEHAVGMAAMPMQQVSAAITGHVAPLIGLEVVRHGINLVMGGFTFVVAQECSGMHSLVALLLTGFILVELSGLNPHRRVVAIALILPIVLIANVFRLIVVLLLGQYLGPDFALGVVVHGFSDIIVYFAAVLSLVLAIGWMYDHQRSRLQVPGLIGIAVDELEGVSAADCNDSTQFAGSCKQQ